MEFTIRLLIMAAISFLLSSSNMIKFSAACNPRDREALLNFKHNLIDPYDYLSSSWVVGNDCCKWKGVFCENITDGDVVQLKLRDFGLSGELNSSILELKHLYYLDLSHNNFKQIPAFLGSLQNLQYLGLSTIAFAGKVPPQLGNLSSLYYLDLSFNTLEGEIPKTLGNLCNLEVLNLSYSILEGEIPVFLGSLKNLTYLDLSDNGFTGKVPPQLDNLSSLYYLDLSYNKLEGEIPRTLEHLCNLEVLHLADNNLQGELSRLFTNSSRCSANKLKSLQLDYNQLSGPLPDELGTLHNLEELSLTHNSFSGSIPTSLGRLSFLRVLDLSDNNLNGPLPETFGNLSSLEKLWITSTMLEGQIPRTLGLCNLEVLDLSLNKLQGEISSRSFTNSSRCYTNKLKSLNLKDNLLSGRLPDELGTLENLEELSLAGNSFSGSIPMSLGRLSLLTKLDLSNNKLNGSLPESFRNLSSLQELYISLQGFLTEANLDNLTRLKVLDIDSLVLNVSHDWVPPFQLQKASLRNCSVGKRFPEWLQTQKSLSEVDVSNAGISGSVPSWFSNMTSQLHYLNISHNQIEGELPNMFSMRDFHGIVDMNSNRFTGNLPRISSPVYELDLSKNTFSGPISKLLCYPNTYSLILLDLSENHLSGELPDCWFYWRSLAFIYLHSNNITGKIPSSMGFLLQLHALRLQNNSLSGEFPSSLRNCTLLSIIDVGENRLTGHIPSWLGESLTTLTVLRLRSNEFNSEIPRKLCYLTKLQIMDLGHNNLFGSIPKCFSNFSTMASKRYSDAFPLYYVPNTEYTVDFVVKGKDMVYGQSLLKLVATIDLSSNNLYGEIPEELTYLYDLQILNFGNNRFTGKIPNKIGLLSSLESLDLSNNRLSGSIPQSMVNLTFLSYLNLSYNNLSGGIPSGTQLQSFSEFSYIGNYDLCGLPLKNCNEDEQQPRKTPNGDDEDEDWIEMKWFYMGLPFGFVVGFWCLFGVLLVSKSWRYAYLRFLDDIIYSLCTCLKQKKK